LLQAIDGWILAIYIIAKRRIGHGVPHFWAWQGDSIATQID
jgi:hypothetical protein